MRQKWVSRNWNGGSNSRGIAIESTELGNVISSLMKIKAMKEAYPKVLNLGVQTENSLGAMKNNLLFIFLLSLDF